MLLNCDLGEGMAYDEEIMPLIDMANIACGMHAGSAEEMRKNIIQAKVHGVTIGAHPGYPDRASFGRVSMSMDTGQLETTMLYQLGALDALCRAENAHFDYVKPHGALYNDMMKSNEIFETILKTVHEYNNRLKLMILSTPENGRYENIADRYDIGLFYEVFADRNYTDEGYLVPRSQKNAVIHDVDEIVRRITAYKDSAQLLSGGGKALQMECDTLCIHGDNEKSLEVIKALNILLSKTSDG
jgi:UPF0271 protein